MATAYSSRALAKDELEEFEWVASQPSLMALTFDLVRRPL